jgi:hypothetical protein
MHEAMARYQYVYGMKPIGPHRKEADRILGGLRKRCDSCAGAGLVWPEGERSCRVCVACEGTGGFWSCSPAELEAAREEVLALHPGAAASRTGIRFLSGALAHHLATGEMVDLREAEEPSG